MGLHTPEGEGGLRALAWEAATSSQMAPRRLSSCDASALLQVTSRQQALTSEAALSMNTHVAVKWDSVAAAAAENKDRSYPVDVRKRARKMRATVVEVQSETHHPLHVKTRVVVRDGVGAVDDDLRYSVLVVAEVLAMSMTTAGDVRRGLTRSLSLSNDSHCGKKRCSGRENNESTGAKISFVSDRSLPLFSFLGSLSPGETKNRKYEILQQNK
jgi:hypothetical protein